MIKLLLGRLPPAVTAGALLTSALKQKNDASSVRPAVKKHTRDAVPGRQERAHAVAS